MESWDQERWDAAWGAIDELVGDQQLQAALDQVEPLIEQARAEAAAGAEDQWSRSLVVATQLRIALHGYETSVRALREAEWPRTPAHRGAIQLSYAAALSAYLDAYGWEIRQRERTIDRDAIDLKAWTGEQIAEEIHAAFGAAWVDRGEWGTADVGTESVALGGLLGKNSYPERIRGTMRDRVSHLWADHLANSSWWTPKQSNAVPRLELAPLISVDGEALLGVDVATDLLLAGGSAAAGAEAAPTEGAGAHPLERAAAVLADLQRWHRRAGRAEAAMEAERRRVELVWQNAQSSTTRQRRVRDHWAARTEGTAQLDRSLPWWSRAQMTAADMWHQSDPERGALRAHQLATAARDAHPQSVGGRLAASLVENLESPQIQISGMWADGPGRRSIQVNHRNLETVHFRAWALDLEQRLVDPADGDWLVNYRTAPPLMAGPPDLRWSAELPPTPDFRAHRTFVTPPMKEPGLYLVAASTEPGPAENQWQIAFPFLVTDLVLVSRDTQAWSAQQGAGGLGELASSLGDDGRRGVEVRVLHGDTGRPVEGAEVVTYRRPNRRQALRPRVVGRTDAHGTLVLGAGEVIPNGENFLLLARHEGQVAYDANGRWMQVVNDAPEFPRTMLYTDRSVYRPEQDLHWKVVAFEPGEGGAKAADYRVLAGAAVEVTLVDANGEEVDKTTARTNGFGSVSGTFRTKPGRMLGGWSVRALVQGETRSQSYASVRVEEYKRPTFEVTVDDPDDELRLDTEAELVGSARYYFGLPVDGSANWRVTREPVYPWWWDRWRGGHRGGTETIAQGLAEIDAEGRFRVRFLPEAGEDAAADAGEGAAVLRRFRSAVSYRYRLSVDVTDEGGETRSAERAFQLGFVSVRASIGRDATFYRAQALRSGELGELSIRRTDLDGVPRAGAGAWRLVRLEQPDETPLPADLPALPPEVGSEFTTAGDRLRPRQSPQYRVAEILRSWREGEEVARGMLDHDDSGSATVDLGALPRRARLAAGAYRLVYSTQDSFGAAYETVDEFLVVDERRSRPLALPALLLVEQGTRAPGEVARVLVHSGLDVPLALGVHRGGDLQHRIRLAPSDAPRVIEIPIGRELRGGFGLSMDVVGDHQLIPTQAQVWVPWSDRELQISFETFRDLLRPGQTETWRVKVRGQDDAGVAVPLVEAAEILAYMYDRSLDVFGAHNPPQTSGLQPGFARTNWPQSSLAQLRTVWQQGRLWLPKFSYAGPSPDRFDLFSGYGIGGPGIRDRWRSSLMRQRAAPSRAEMAFRADGAVVTVTSETPVLQERRLQQGARVAMEELERIPTASEPGAELNQDPGVLAEGANTGSESMDPAEIRTDFSETAFWEPHLIVDPEQDGGSGGSVTFEFTVPDAVTEWNVWVHGLTRDLRGGSLQQQTRTAKDLLVRPYLPRFLREGDAAELVTVVSNSGETTLDGELAFDIVDPVTEESLLAEFGLDAASARRPFRVEPGASADVSFAVTAPARVGMVAFRVVGSAADLSDGELRPIPVLPGRFHLIQSRFTALDGSRPEQSEKTLRFEELAAASDPTRTNQQLVVTLDSQLFYSVLNAVPYLVDYPYECTEQTLNRFLSTGILATLFADYPAVATMAEQLAERETRYAAFDGPDANRSTESAMLLEETPWLQQSRGRDARDDGRASPDLLKVLDPEIAATQQRASLRKLLEAQNNDGGFPWWTNGRSSPYLTLYVLDGLSRALEFGVTLPNEARNAVQRGWRFLDQHYRANLFQRLEGAPEDGCCVEFVTYLNYVFSNLELASADQGAGGSGVEQWTGGLFDAERRAKLLDHSFTHWRRHSPRLKAYLALTLHRAGRGDDAQLVFASIMDSAKSDDDLGTYWAQEDRSWLWYRDTVESHAFILRALTELDPSDDRRHGLVQWLFLEKKLTHWKSTRATAEAIYALIHYLEKEGQLGQSARAAVQVGDISREFLWTPDEYTGAKNQVVVPAELLDTPAEERAHAEVTVTRESAGLMFASATWHFSTEQLPAEASSDFFGVERAYFLREQTPDGPVLRPLRSGARIAVGDEIEVQLSLRSRHDAEYVHLRDPRAAGFEPVTQRSGWSWDLGIPRYEEVRDSGTNFFIERLPVGEYTLKYRIRASVAGTFKAAPATVQSMYAPEFAAYSSGTTLRVEP